MAEKKCLECGTTDKDAYLVVLERNGKTEYVCTGCLPILIHGGH